MQQSDLDHYSMSIKDLNYYFWTWMKRHFEDVLEFVPTTKIHISHGVVGKPKRNRGKAVWTGDLHPEMIKYLETPDAIRLIHHAMCRLHSTDWELYTFIYLRSSGYTYAEIDYQGWFDHSLTKQSKRKDHGGVIAKEITRDYNRRSLAYFISAIPRPHSRRWASDTVLDEILSKPRIRRDERYEWVICPRCKGTSPECPLCHRRDDTQWNGKVQRHRANTYLKKVSLGTWKE